MLQIWIVVVTRTFCELGNVRYSVRTVLVRSRNTVARIHGGLHTLVPFAVEDGGRLGAHAQAFLRSLAERAVRQGRRSRPAMRDPSGAVVRSDGATQVSLWVQRWQRHISS